MRFRPCIDLHHGQVKQIVGGSLGSGETPKTNFVSDRDAAYYAQIYREDRLTGGHVIMLGPGNEGEALKALQAYPGGLQVGGGITAENATKFLEAGASHVIVTSYVFRQGQLLWENLEKIVSEVGKERLVLDLSCRRRGGEYLVVTDRWQTFTEFMVTSENLRRLSQYCDEFLIHAVDVEGKCSGIELDLVKILGEWGSIPLTYAGGISSFADLKILEEQGHSRLDFTIGSALDLFGGTLPYQEVVRRYA